MVCVLHCIYIYKKSDLVWVFALFQVEKHACMHALGQVGFQDKFETNKIRTNKKERDELSIDHPKPKP